MADLIKAITEADKELRMSDKNPMWEAHDVEMDDKATDDKGIDNVLRNYLWTAYCCGRANNTYIPEEVMDGLYKALKSKNVVRLADNQELPDGNDKTPMDDFQYTHYLSQKQLRDEHGFRRVRHLDGTEL